jgi:hypothetical protein
MTLHTVQCTVFRNLLMKTKSRILKVSIEIQEKRQGKASKGLFDDIWIFERNELRSVTNFLSVVT